MNKYVLTYKRSLTVDDEINTIPFEYSSIEQFKKDFKNAWKKEQGITNTFIFLNCVFECIDFVDFSSMEIKSNQYLEPKVQTLDEWFEENQMMEVRQKKIKNINKEL